MRTRKPVPATSAMSPSGPTLLDLLADPAIFAPLFAGPTWRAWIGLLAAVFGLPVPEDVTDIVRRCTGRSALPTQPARELWAIIGRRGGKSRIAALLAVYLACFKRYTLAPGERGIVMVLAADRRQARVVLRYVKALIDHVPMLDALVERQTTEAIHLRNGITIEIHTASFKTTRGYTVVGAICDEIAFWPTDESANPDTEILNALRPAAATVPGALLVAISSPYARRGELFTAHEKHFGREDDPVLVWQADSKTMNPAIPDSVIDAAYAADPVVAAAEWGAEFRGDLTTLFLRDALDTAVAPERYELPCVPGREYVGFVDPSGGSADSMTLAIAHATADGRAVLDLLREARPPFSPDDVTREFAAVLHGYGIYTVQGDHYAGEWPRERFAVHDVTYEPADATKSDLFLRLLPAVNSRRVELLDQRRLLAQLTALQRRTSRGGRDSVDHPPGGHDDVANAAAGALVRALSTTTIGDGDLIGGMANLTGGQPVF